MTTIRLERNSSKTDAGDAIQQQSLITIVCYDRQYTVGYPSDSVASCSTFLKPLSATRRVLPVLLSVRSFRCETRKSIMGCEHEIRQ